MTQPLETISHAQFVLGNETILCMKFQVHTVMSVKMTLIIQTANISETLANLCETSWRNYLDHENMFTHINKFK